MPVALPPGQARLATRPSRTGSWPIPKTIGIVAVAVLAVSATCALPGVTITATWRRTRSAISTGRRSDWAFKPVVLDRYVLAFYVAGFVEPFAKRGHIRRVGIGRPVSDKCDDRYCGLLSARSQRPSRSAAEKRDELPPPHFRPQPQETALYRSKRVLF